MADKKLFALCVGINKYPEGVSDLAGCITDAENWKSFIETHYQTSLSPEILLLTDAQATRAGFIDAFRNHLGQARDGDTIFLHYSGHGSREKAPPAYLKFFPDGMNETLVLSDSRAKDDSGNYTGYDLADKELGRLLEEVIEGKPNLNLIVSLDCCHSGSGTRDVDKLASARLTGDRADEARSFETYIPGIFTGAEVVLPSSKHVLLASCSKYQKAWETKEKTGLFTTSAMDVLAKYGSQTTLADLYTRTRTVMRKTTNIQDPQLEVYERYNANRVIFTGEVLEGAAKYSQRIYFFDKSWRIDFGAMQGMPNDRITELAVYENIEEISKQNTLGNAKSVEVMGDKTNLSLDFDANQDKEYVGEFLKSPITPMNVFVYGDQAGYEALKSNYEENPSMYFNLEKIDGNYTINLTNEGVQYYTQVSVLNEDGQLITPKSGDYLLAVHNGGIYLLDEDSRLIQGLDGGYQDEKGITILFEVLDDIAKWENLATLQNKNPKINPDKVEFNLFSLDGEVMEGNDFVSYFREVTKKGQLQWAGSEFDIKAKNNTNQGLYFAFIELNEMYEILVHFNEHVKSDLEAITLIENAETWIESINDDAAKTVYNKDLDIYHSNKSVLILKLIVSTEKFDDFTFNQDPIDIGFISDGRGFKSRSRTPTSTQVSNDWFVKTITINTLRQQSSFGNNDLKLGSKKQLSIKGNTEITASVTLTASKSGSRSAAEKTSLMTSLLEKQAGNLVNFGGDAGGSNILEINDIQGSEKLAENPLEITLNEEVSEDEMLLPFTFDGEHILSIGEAETIEDGSTNIAIDDIPEVEEGSRGTNVGKSLKLAFYKIALKRRPDKIYQLAWVEYLGTK